MALFTLAGEFSAQLVRIKFFINAQNLEIMKKELVINEPFLKELSMEKLKKVDGGLFGVDDVLYVIAVAAITNIINDWDNFERGLQGKPYKPE